MDMRVGLSPTSLRELYQSQRYVDMTIVCDDGTLYPVCRAIICAQSKTIEAAMNSPFTEGRSNEYHLSGKESAVVGMFLDIMHGKDFDKTAFDSESTTTTKDARQDAILPYAKVYALADELQADSIIKCCCQCVGYIASHAPLANEYLDVMDAFQFVDDNAVRTLPFYEVIIKENFIGRGYDMDLPTQLSILARNQCYHHLMNDPERRLLFSKLALSDEPGPDSFLANYIDDPDFQDLARQKDFAASIIERRLRGSDLQLSDLSEDQRFTTALRGSPLAYDFLEAVLSDPWRVGRSIMAQCRTCKTIFFLGTTHITDRSYCDFCEQQTNMNTSLHYIFMRNSHESLDDGEWAGQLWTQ